MLGRRTIIPEVRPPIYIGYKYNTQKLVSYISQKTQGEHIHIIPISLSTLNIVPMSPFTLLFAPLSCISSLDLLIRLTLTTNQGSLVWSWISSGLTSVVVYGYVRQFIWGLPLLISGKYLFMGLRYTTMKN